MHISFRCAEKSNGKDGVPRFDVSGAMSIIRTFTIVKMKKTKKMIQLVRKITKLLTVANSMKRKSQYYLINLQD